MDPGSVNSVTSPRVSLLTTVPATDAITIGVRPGDFDVRSEGGLDAMIDVVEELGSEAFLYCTADETDKHIVARVEGLSPAERGEHVRLVPKPNVLHLFDAATGHRLPD